MHSRNQLLAPHALCFDFVSTQSPPQLNLIKRDLAKHFINFSKIVRSGSEVITNSHFARISLTRPAPAVAAEKFMQLKLQLLQYVAEGARDPNADPAAAPSLLLNLGLSSLLLSNRIRGRYPGNVGALMGFSHSRLCAKCPMAFNYASSDCFLAIGC